MQETTTARRTERALRQEHSENFSGVYEIKAPKWDQLEGRERRQRGIEGESESERIKSRGREQCYDRGEMDYSLFLYTREHYSVLYTTWE